MSDCSIPLPVFTETETALIEELRSHVGSRISSAMEDMDCMRFLRARKCNVTLASSMVMNWYEWRHTHLEPIPPYEDQLVMTPEILLTFPRPIDRHPHSYLLPTSHHGFDREGRPIYWEKTGYIQSTMPQIKEHFSNTELLHFHIMSQEIFDMRFKFASKKFGHHVHQCVIVFDLAGVSASLDFDSIHYVKNILKIDQDYYPERLYKLIVINSPWYFPALFNLFYYLMDAKTRDKFVILNSDFLPKLSEIIDPSVIPVEYGGDCPEGGEEGVHWDLKFPDCTGCSREQIEHNTRDRLLRHCDHITAHEAVNMFKALNLSEGYEEGAVALLEHMRLVEKDMPEGEDKNKMKAALKSIENISIFSKVQDKEEE